MRMYDAESREISLEVDAGNVALEIDNIVPCGLVISELLSNSFKDAFPGDRKGEIRIHAMVTEDDEILLVIWDDVVGMPTDIDIRTTSSTGLGLVMALVEKQLGGRLTLERTRGTCYTIVIPQQEVAHA